MSDLATNARTTGPLRRDARRTREAVQDALITLACQKEYRDIRVDELCEEAGVGRSTFYQHFASKDDVKSRGAMRLWTKMRAIQQRSGNIAWTGRTANPGHRRRKTCSPILLKDEASG
ncbi:TetR/AcrR family transcriptional regulator [Nitratireductor rhodophyticola]